MKIPVLSIWQPWASLIANGLKTIETRTEPAPAELLGKRIAIHASVSDSKRHVYEWIRSKYPTEMAQVLNGKEFEDLPRGQVLAFATLIETRKTDWRDWPKTMSPVEDFWGWVLADIEILESPIPLNIEAGLTEAELDC
jgi:hypothetical protein